MSCPNLHHVAQAVDYSFARPNPADLAAAGYVGALRYLAPLPNAKVITGDEIASLHANGLSVGFVWESTATRPRDGYDAGHADAQEANRQADELGVPPTVTIYFAVDFDASASEVVEYFGGALIASKRPIGGYGSFRVVESLLDAQFITKAWQTVAWSRRNHSARAVLYQRADAAANPPPGCDVNEVLQDDWGQWAPAGAPQPQPVPKEDDDVTMLIRFEGDPQVYAKNALGYRKIKTQEDLNILAFTGLVNTPSAGPDGVHDVPADSPREVWLTGVDFDAISAPQLTGTFEISGSGSVG